MISGSKNIALDTPRHMFTDVGVSEIWIYKESLITCEIALALSGSACIRGALGSAGVRWVVPMGSELLEIAELSELSEFQKCSECLELSDFSDFYMLSCFFVAGKCSGLSELSGALQGRILCD